MKKFPVYKQLDAKDCGSSCLKIIAKFFNKSVPIEVLRDACETTRGGSSLLNLSEAAEKIGLRSLCVKITLDDIIDVSL